MANPPTTLERLRVFHAVASYGTIAGAARALGYTPSAVSQHVAALEREVATSLVERSNRGIAPTLAGSTLALRASNILDLVRNAIDETRVVGGSRAAEITLAAFPTAITAMVLPLCRRLTPGITISVVDAEAEVALRALVQREVDAAITDGFAVDPREHAGQLHRTLLLVEPLHVVARRDDKRPALRDYTDAPWVLGAATTRLGRVARDACYAAGFQPNVVVETVDHHVAFDSITATGAVSILPALALTSLPPDVVVIDHIDLGLERHVELVTRSSLHQNPTLASLAVQLINEVS